VYCIRKRLLVWALAALLCPAQQCGADTAREIASKAMPSLLLLVMADTTGQPISLGSGFIVDDGIVVTNLHVLSGSASGTSKVVGSKQTFAIGGVVAVDAEHDLALLQIEGIPKASLPLADSSKCAVGDVVYAVGNPQGFEGTMSQGIISGLRTLGKASLLQITAPISPGSSGGPVLNESGAVVGVAVATYTDGQNLNFAVPAKRISDLLQKRGNVQRLAALRASAPAESVPSFVTPSVADAIEAGNFEWIYKVLDDGDFSFTLIPVQDRFSLKG